MKKIFLVLIMIVPTFLCGCQVMSSFGGLAIWSAAAYKITVINETKDLRLVVKRGREIMNPYYIMPGETFTFNTDNFFDKSQEYTLVTRAEDSSGNVIGFAVKKLTVESHQAGAEPWEIKTSDLHLLQ